MVVGGHEGAVCGAGRVEVIRAIGQLDSQVLDGPFQALDSLHQLEGVRSLGLFKQPSDAGCFFAEQLGQPGFEELGVRSEPAMCGVDVGCSVRSEISLTRLVASAGAGVSVAWTTAARSGWRCRKERWTPAARATAEMVSGVPAR